MLRVVEMAVSDARARGIDIDVVAADDREDEAVAMRVAAELVSDLSVIAVVGHKNSGPSRAAAPIYAAAGLTQITQCSTDNLLSRSGWRTFFRLCADNERQAAVAAEFAYAQMPRGRAVAVHDRTAYGTPLVEAFARRFLELSGNPVQVLAMHVGQDDFTEIVDAVRKVRAEIVDLGATEIESSKLMRALRAGGLHPLIISSEGGSDNPIVKLAGEAGEGSVHTYAGANPLATTASSELVARCRAELGETPSYLVECYDAVSVIAAAIEHGATSRPQVRDAVATTDAEGLGGRIRFAANGDRVDAPVSLWRIEGGRMLPLSEQPVR
jgi:branched-chain amino acid transport system substrate-binding protein